MIRYEFKQQGKNVCISVWLCGAMVFGALRYAPAGSDPLTYFDTEASRATLLEAAQPTIDRLREYFK
jgi:hypothetical protein